MRRRKCRIRIRAQTIVSTLAASCQSFQPRRYWYWMNSSAGLQFVARKCFVSHSILHWQRWATLPNSTDSVSDPDYSKLHVVAAPVLHACAQSL